MLALHAVAAVLATFPLAPTTSDDENGDPGFVATVLPEYEVGTNLVVQLQAPWDAFSLIFLDTERGSTDTKYGTLCLDLPALGAVPLRLRNGGPRNLVCNIPCDPAFIGIDVYTQFIALRIGDSSQFGRSNLTTSRLIDSYCLRDRPLCTAPADSDPLYHRGGSGHAVWIPGLGTDYVWASGGDLVEHQDGSARISGVLASRSDDQNCWMVDVDLSGRLNYGDRGHAPDGSPKRELDSSAYVENGGPIDTSSWTYFENTTGVFIGLCDNLGCTLDIRRKGPAFQIGPGANGKNLHDGASGWFDAELHCAGQQSSFHGDFNLDFCVDNNQCTAPAGDHALTFKALGDDFLWESGGEWIENRDGTAELRGVLVNDLDPTNRWNVDLAFSGRVNTANPEYPPAGSPKREMSDSHYIENGGPIDTASWYYYTGIDGTLSGLDLHVGALVQLDRMGPALQVGLGAAGKSVEYGASCWFAATTLVQPSRGSIPDSFDGDLNIDLDRCD